MWKKAKKLNWQKLFQVEIRGKGRVKERESGTEDISKRPKLGVNTQLRMPKRLSCLEFTAILKDT